MKRTIAWVRRAATAIAIASFAKIALSAEQSKRQPAQHDQPAPIHVPTVPSRTFLTDKKPTLIHEHSTQDK